MKEIDWNTFQQLPRRQKDTWQGMIVRTPQWAYGTNETLFRLRGGFWISLKTRNIHLGRRTTPEENGSDLLVEAFAEFATDPDSGPSLPGRVEITDPDVARKLRDPLAFLGVEVAVVPRLRTAENAWGEVLERTAQDRALPPSPLEPPGMTIERWAAFTDAAREFALAEPWRRLHPDDLLRVESPHPAEGMGLFSVLGLHRDHYGLTFYESASQFESSFSPERESDKELIEQSAWDLHFGPLEAVPLTDADLFEDHPVPVAAADRYPVLLRIGPKKRLRRAGSTATAFIEGLLRVLALTQEANIDMGRWTVEVPTFDGPLEFTLALPDLVDRPSAASHPSLDQRANEKVLAAIQRTPREQSQDLCNAAFEARGHKQILLARRAIELFPDCVDAHTLLGERAPDDEAALLHYEVGVAAGSRFLKTLASHRPPNGLWGNLETRPYLRALLGLAQTLLSLDRHSEALPHFNMLIELDPNDHQGARFDLVPLLITLNQDAKAAEVLDQYRDDEAAAMEDYARALLAFRKEGDSPAARESRDTALQTNPFAADFLIDDTDFFHLPSSFGRGDEKEGFACAFHQWEAWKATPGALDWLEDGRETEPT